LPASDAPDGAIVEKGGAAQRMRTDLLTATQRGERRLYTCNGNCTAGGLLSSTLFNTANTNASGPSATKLGVLEANRDALINWVRGEDNKEDENLNLSTTDSRAYVHGDLLHSRPAVVNYNRSDGNRDVVIYYGANDGIFRAIKGGQNDADGYELWGMIFPEHFDRFSKLRENDTVIGVSTTKPYFADGPVSVYQHDVNNDGRLVASDGDKVYLFIGMRRGGQMYYALDVSDPDAPRFLWKIDEATTGFSLLGQSWSTPRPTLINAASDPVLIFGGGYDPAAEDASSPGTNSMGQGVYVVNAVTGALIKHINPTGMAAVPADITALDRDSNGKSDRLYVPDTRGNVWRIDIENANPELWAAHQIAALGGTGGDARKLLNKVDVVFGRTFDAVLVGSGNRESPFDTSVTDRFYMIQDTFIGLAGGLFCGTSTTKVTCTHTHLTDVTSNSFQDQALPSTSNGWYLTFLSGEKLVSSPLTVFGTVIFSTNRPTPSTSGTTCGNLGEARLYQVAFGNAGATQDTNADGVVNVFDRYQVVPGGGFLPSAVYSPVEVGGRRREVVCVGTRCFDPGGKGFDSRRYRTYWYKK
jgi:type IV pilus assembly protein PilY1